MSQIVLGPWKHGEWTGIAEYWSRYEFPNGLETVTVELGEDDKWRAYTYDIPNENDTDLYVAPFSTMKECMQFVDAKLIALGVRLLTQEEATKLSLLL